LVGHACAILNDGNNSLIFDPWFSGTAFNNGWRLPQDLDFSNLDLSRITHVCITHEHPDHFHIPTLKKINNLWDPIFILQETSDKRMVDFINNMLGKRVVELSDGCCHRISPSLSISLYSHGHMDSFALVEAGDVSILNINDCVLKDRQSLAKLRKRIHRKSIDILMSQYSFASYQGNKADVDDLQKANWQHLEWIKQRNDFFRPKIFLPFASGIVWCSKENEYLNNYTVNYNDAVNALKECANPPLCLEKSVCEILHIRDLRVTSDFTHEVETSHRSYNDSPLPMVVQLDIELQERLEKLAYFARKTLNKQNLSIITKLMKFLGFIGILKPILIKLRLFDGNDSYIGLKPGLEFLYFENTGTIDASFRQCCISMSIDSIEYCLQNQFGAETLWVNSRFEVIKGNKKDFFKHFFPSILSNQGFHFPLGYVRYLWNRVILQKLL